MSDFKAKMHQIRFLLGVCPGLLWESLQPYSAVLKRPTSNERRGGGGFSVPKIFVALPHYDWSTQNLLATPLSRLGNNKSICFCFLHR